MSDTNPTNLFLTTLSQKTGQMASLDSSGKVMVCCPAHDDRNPSLSVSMADDGTCLLKCFAGCSVKEITDAVGLTMKDLFPSGLKNGSNVRHSSSDRNGAGFTSSSQNGSSSKRKSTSSKVVAIYDYHDENGKLLFQVLRTEDKTFSQRKPKPDGNGWEYKTSDVRKVLYRLPELMANPDKVVMITEGEKDADCLRSFGLLATCNPGGAGKWKDDFSSLLKGRSVVIFPDNDEPGRKHAQQVAESLQKFVQVENEQRQVKVIELPNLSEKGDVSDWLDVGGTLDELKKFINDAPIWKAEETKRWNPSDPWEPLIPLVPALPDFPVDVLPEPLRTYVSELAHATQTPVDLSAMVVLPAIRTAMRGRVYVKAREGLIEPTNIFTVVLLEPGNRKSPVFRIVTQALRDVQQELIEAARPAVARAKSGRKQKEKRLARLQKQAAEKGDEQAAAEAGDLAEELETTAVPELPRMIIENTTAERLEMILDAQDGVISVMSPEGGSFDIIQGIYSNSANGTSSFDVYLKGHAGDDIATARVGRDDVFIERPQLTCCFTVQPTVFEGLNDQKILRGRGLLARFLFAVPFSPIGDREIRPEPVSQETELKWEALIRRLSNITIPDEGMTLTLSEEADGELYFHEKWIEEELGYGGLSIMKDWGAKLAGATLRIAGILHMVKHQEFTRRIDKETMQAAIAISHYLIPHARYVYTQLSDENPIEDELGSQVRYILKRLKKLDSDQISVRDAHQKWRRKFKKPEEMLPALKVLAKHNYIRELTIERKSAGRKPSPLYQVNPKIFETPSPANCTQNTQNGSQASPESHSVYSVYNSGGSENQIEDEREVF